MKRIILMLAVCAPLLALHPVEVSAQYCHGYCDGCYDPELGEGHFYLPFYSAHTGFLFHNCGGIVGCEWAGHYACSPFASLWPDGTLDSFLDLSGKELYALVGELDGRVVYNSDRHAIQVQACDDRSLIVVSIPLGGRQLADLLGMTDAADD